MQPLSGACCLYRVLQDLQGPAAEGRRGAKLFDLFPQAGNKAHFIELDSRGAPIHVAVIAALAACMAGAPTHTAGNVERVLRALQGYMRSSGEHARGMYLQTWQSSAQTPPGGTGASMWRGTCRRAGRSPKSSTPTACVLVLAALLLPRQNALCGGYTMVFFCSAEAGTLQVIVQHCVLCLTRSQMPSGTGERAHPAEQGGAHAVAAAGRPRQLRAGRARACLAPAHALRGGGPGAEERRLLGGGQGRDPGGPARAAGHAAAPRRSAARALPGGAAPAARGRPGPRPSAPPSLPDGGPEREPILRADRAQPPEAVDG